MRRVTQTPWQCSLSLFIEYVHLILVQTLCTAELEPPLTRSKIQVFLSVADVFAPIADLQHEQPQSEQYKLELKSSNVYFKYTNSNPNTLCGLRHH